MKLDHASQDVEELKAQVDQFDKTLEILEAQKADEINTAHQEVMAGKEALQKQLEESEKEIKSLTQSLVMLSIYKTQKLIICFSGTARVTFNPSTPKMSRIPMSLC